MHTWQGDNNRLYFKIENQNRISGPSPDFNLLQQQSLKQMHLILQVVGYTSLNEAYFLNLSANSNASN